MKQLTIYGRGREFSPKIRSNCTIIIGMPWHVFAILKRDDGSKVFVNLIDARFKQESKSSRGAARACAAAAGACFFGVARQHSRVQTCCVRVCCCLLCLCGADVGSPCGLRLPAAFCLIDAPIRSNKILFFIPPGWYIAVAFPIISDAITTRVLLTNQTHSILYPYLP